MSKRGDEWETIGILGEKIIAQIAAWQDLKLQMVHKEIQRMADINGVMVSWTAEKREEFRKEWEAANEAEQVSFTFNGNEYLVTYGRYLLEYLDYVFGQVA